MEKNVLTEQTDATLNERVEEMGRGKFYYRKSAINVDRVLRTGKKTTLKAVISIVKHVLEGIIKHTSRHFDYCITVYSTNNAIVIMKDTIPKSMEENKEDICKKLDSSLIKILDGKNYSEDERIVFEDEEDRMNEIFKDNGNRMAVGRPSMRKKSDRTNIITELRKKAHEESRKANGWGDTKKELRQPRSIFEPDNIEEEEVETTPEEDAGYSIEDMKKGFNEPCIRFNEVNFPLGYFVHSQYELDKEYIRIENVIKLINDKINYHTSKKHIGAANQICDYVIFDALATMYNCEIDGYIYSVLYNGYYAYEAFKSGKCETGHITSRNTSDTQEFMEEFVFNPRDAKKSRPFTYIHESAKKIRSKESWTDAENLHEHDKAWHLEHFKRVIEVCLLAQCDDNLEALCEAFPTMGDYIDDCRELFTWFQTTYTRYDDNFGDFVHDSNYGYGLARRAFLIPMTAFPIPMRSIPNGFMFVLRNDYDKFMRNEISSCEIYQKTEDVGICEASRTWVVPKSIDHYCDDITDHIEFNRKPIGEIVDDENYDTPKEKNLRTRKLERIRETECLLLAEAATVTEGQFEN